jgi:hypothetical protein
MKKKGKRTVHIDQWIEIEKIDGKTVITRYPPNAEFEELRLKMSPPAELIYRRMFFLGSVPDELLSLVGSFVEKRAGGLLLQRITPEEWASILQQEKNLGSDALIPARNPRPRPEEFGPCPCRECKEERAKGLPSRYA